MPETTAPLVKPEVLKKIGPWKPYVEAKLGFKNHWYPVLFSKHIEEGKPVPATLLGVNILLNRIDGKVYCIRDRCIHRGVQFSRKIECHTKGTITCWYHGYTYRWSDGLLTNVLAVPNSKIVDGQRGLRSYPVEEAKGLVFVFLGDADVTEPPLATDVQPGFLDEDTYVVGRIVPVKSNWRQGVENGFDTTHIYIHRKSVLLGENNLLLPLGFAPTEVHSWQVCTEEGKPKGILEVYGPNMVPAFEGEIEGERVLPVSSDATGKSVLPSSVGMWMPCGLKVDPWPDPTMTQYEFYVPVDEKNHLYFQCIGTRVNTDEARLKFVREYNNRWEHYALDGFNGDDVWAREAAEDSYADDYQWVDEALFEADANILAFRELISKHNRGIQQLSDLRG